MLNVLRRELAAARALSFYRCRHGGSPKLSLRREYQKTSIEYYRVFNSMNYLRTLSIITRKWAESCWEDVVRLRGGRVKSRSNSKDVLLHGSLLMKQRQRFP